MNKNLLSTQQAETKNHIRAMLRIIDRHVKTLADMDIDKCPRAFNLNLEVLEDAVMVLRKNQIQLDHIKTLISMGAV